MGQEQRTGRPHLARHRWIQVLIGVDGVAALMIATQYVAWRLGFQVRLGPAILSGMIDPWPWWLATWLLMGASLVLLRERSLRRAAGMMLVLFFCTGWVAWAAAGCVYAPDRFLVWAYSYRHVAALGPVMRAGWMVFGIAWGVLLAVTLGPLSYRRSSALASGAHGTAAWGDGQSFRQPEGLAIGRDDKHRLLRYAGDGHLLTVAPTRSGKGVSAVIPTLLTYPGAIMVTDPKGENFAVTARARKEMGCSVYALDPFQVAGGAARLNPLDAIDPTSGTAHDDAWGLADMIVVSDRSSAGGAAEFWNEEARALLAGLILHVLTSAPAELRHLPRVRELITLPPEPFATLLGEMQRSTAAFGLVSRAATRLLQKEDRERSGVISSVQNHTHFLDSPRIQHVLTESTFSFQELVTGQATCYLILPPSHLRTYRRWLRLLIGRALQTLTDVRTHGRKSRVLFLLDEFAHLGRLRPVEDGVSLAGGYGATFWVIVQDLAQLRQEYPDGWEHFLASADVLKAFGVNDYETAEHLSRLTGDATVLVASENFSAGVTHGRSEARQEGQGRTWSERGRRLMTPDEVRRLASDRALVFVKGTHPLHLRRINYLIDREFAGRFDANPMHAVERLHE